MLTGSDRLSQAYFGSDQSPCLAHHSVGGRAPLAVRCCILGRGCDFLHWLACNGSITVFRQKALWRQLRDAKSWACAGVHPPAAAGGLLAAQADRIGMLRRSCTGHVQGFIRPQPQADYKPLKPTECADIRADRERQRDAEIRALQADMGANVNELRALVEQHDLRHCDPSGAHHSGSRAFPNASWLAPLQSQRCA